MTTNISQKIIDTLPYGKHFHFVDEISHIDSEKIIGHYTFKKDAFFYESHFKHQHIIPGVIIIEMMGQIGLVCHQVYLQKLYDSDTIYHPLLSNLQAEFFREVFPDEKLTVISNRIYLRHGILKSKTELYNQKDELCCRTVAQIKIILNS